jgi:hypothetical protein
LNRNEEAIASLERAKKIKPDDLETAEFLAAIQNSGATDIRREVG